MISQRLQLEIMLFLQEEELQSFFFLFVNCQSDMTGVLTVDIFDASQNSWALKSLSEPRHGIAAVSLGMYAFFAGGMRLRVMFHLIEKV
jgi:hypothetical protein